jgi:hypothetical protein
VCRLESLQTSEQRPDCSGSPGLFYQVSALFISQKPMLTVSPGVEAYITSKRWPKQIPPHCSKQPCQWNPTLVAGQSAAGQTILRQKSLLRSRCSAPRSLQWRSARYDPPDKELNENTLEGDARCYSLGSESCFITSIAALPYLTKHRFELFSNTHGPSAEPRHRVPTAPRVSKFRTFQPRDSCFAKGQLSWAGLADLVLRRTHG